MLFRTARACVRTALSLCSLLFILFSFYSLPFFHPVFGGVRRVWKIVFSIVSTEFSSQWLSADGKIHFVSVPISII